MSLTCTTNPSRGRESCSGEPTGSQHTPHDADVNRPSPLTAYSPDDQPWDRHRLLAEQVERIFCNADTPQHHRNQFFLRYANRVRDCAEVLLYGEVVDQGTGEINFALQHTHFCRVRHCPVCQWRRSMMWQARFYRGIPAIANEHPTARWILLTLTTRNCDVSGLREQIQKMNNAWKKMTKRKEMAPVKGWIRTTEVTRGKDGSAHPHFHILMMVPTNMLSGKNYVKHARWVEMWRKCLCVSYDPNVDVRAIKTPKNATEEEREEALKGAVRETLKYATKAQDAIDDNEWFLIMVEQTHRLRFIASGGVLKDILREDEEQNDDLISEESEEETEEKERKIAFQWWQNDMYRRAKDRDVSPE